ncbi:hypothetical protein P171DRAFT_132259 [Karstenula rhodostoma CBS 690.94]|uniref:ferric-chelate reductase (NADPH) n=1 Tax=Karstenula rhodostoma CBS 690.94 TaxID=1392251 RepID=A0A9P4U7G9_9PLEO|nr:hypothetical protein P171DRAFT_132259 [Karstenula rhodostoma CBS 690.94]
MLRDRCGLCLNSLTNMQLLTIYILCLASTIAASCIWRSWRLLDNPTIWSFLRRQFLYTLLCRRLRTSSDINVLAGINLLVFGAANITACTLWIQNPAELGKRCGTLFIVNVIPLYLGGRTNFLIDKVFRLQLNEYSLLHRWLGRVCVMQGLLHGVLSGTMSSLSVAEITLLSLLAALGCLSLLHIRRLIHQKSSRSTTIITLERLSGPHTTSPGAMKVVFRFESNKSSDLGPGQYVYLTAPGLHRHSLGFLQSHPYVIAWIESTEPNEKHGESQGGHWSEITILVERNKGFSDAIFALKRTSSFLIDGPYGHIQSLDHYDKVLFMASGIGVAAHLLHIRHLLEAHNTKSARVRRITLVWFLETSDQERWAKPYLESLQDKDSSNKDGYRIFIYKRYLPSPQRSRTMDKDNGKRLYEIHDRLDMSKEIEGEGSADGGNIAVSVCGNPHFESAIRKAVRSSNYDVHLFMHGFRPEETETGRLSRDRYCWKSGFDNETQASHSNKIG